MNYIVPPMIKRLHSLNDGMEFHLEYRDKSGLSGMAGYDEAPARHSIDQYLTHAERVARTASLASGTIVAALTFLALSLPSFIIFIIVH